MAGLVARHDPPRRLVPPGEPSRVRHQPRRHGALVRMQRRIERQHIARAVEPDPPAQLAPALPDVVTHRIAARLP